MDQIIAEQLRAVFPGLTSEELLNMAQARMLGHDEFYAATYEFWLEFTGSEDKAESLTDIAQSIVF